MSLPRKITRKLRNLHHRYLGGPEFPFPYEGYVELRDQQANDLLRARILDDSPLLVTKFGTVELHSLLNALSVREGFSLRSWLDYVAERRYYLGWWEELQFLHRAAGVFPGTPETGMAFADEYLRWLPEIDILGSYLPEESLVADRFPAARKVNLDGYYAPFLFRKPWTGALAGRRVLVVHPFEESIRSQYAKRRLLFRDPEVLPDFELVTLKAVQSVEGEDPGFPSWTEALQHMKDGMDRLDYDIALVGCGAYGFPLAAHAKSRGKKAVHLAGWTQMLFGIYGERWKSGPAVNPQVAGFINEHWVRPGESERPRQFRSIENGCYW